jgi:hypothetical protein
MGLISADALLMAAERLKQSSYGEYLLRVFQEATGYSVRNISASGYRE